MTRNDRTSLGAVGALLGLALMALAGCARSTAIPARSSAAPRPARTTTVSPGPSSPAGQAIAAYTAMWADVQVASQTLTIAAATGGTSASPGTPSYQNPILQQHLDGQALLTIEENLDTDEAQGIIALGAPVLHPTVASATPTAVQLTDCLDGTHWLQYYAVTRELVNNTPGGFSYTTATVTDETGGWKVTQLDVRADGTCHVTE
jgi:hypothetical protein